MSFYQQNLEAFLQLLQQQPQLFTESKRQELLAVIEPLPDEIETLSVAIASWYETDDEIVDAQLDILNNSILMANNSSSDAIAPLALARFSKNNVDDVPKLNQPLNKETLKKAIQTL
ncbi:hypothetical protein PCC9214_01349 [Planktothrix tepida]|uniref:Uncharacterized protein n=2 Tax=Planktothrix TaxID=54304 RepID=A0A1J1LGK4_9CYAN|nr:MULTISPECIES: hypothetical protein [Planktothrix]CAD5932026.1 hypothetical protein PCC9214_01349 [Planktothrix tepida]CAD5978538.1 hypothetical protein NO713_04407 [Planktothrix pseudagardhii]CUR31643.1 conserved hypothetical protein [Planktothrix tepida PCC 9214]